MENNDFLLEKRLDELNKDLSSRVKDTAFLMVFTLDKYKNYFPDYTDHTINHSLHVIEFCNSLIGEENINKLNEDEIFILLMGCYLHDSGMGISQEDYKTYYDVVVSEKFQKENPAVSVEETIRNFHQEFSGKFINKYYELLEIPSKEYMEAIISVSRGHRKSDLYNENEFPSSYKLSNGNTVCLPYLAALIRLSDEMDIASDRNLSFVYSDYNSTIHKKVHRAIKAFKIEKNKFVIHIKSNDASVLCEANNVLEKLKDTLNYCRDVVSKRSKYRISQKTIEILMEN